MTETWRDYSVEEENEKADKALGVEFTNDLRLLLEKYKVEMVIEPCSFSFPKKASGRTDNCINFYSPSKYTNGERVKANLDVYFTGIIAASDLT